MICLIDDASAIEVYLCDAQIDLGRGSVICSTRPNEYVNLSMLGDNLWGGKSLHTNDGPAFYASMRENIKLRVANFLEAKKE